MRLQAIWTGRFQPPTKAHLATARRILESWERLTIVVAYEIAPPDRMLVEWQEYIRLSGATSYAPGKNIFSHVEVVTMWQAAIDALDLQQRVIVCANGRPEFDETFRQRFPENAYDFVTIRLPETESVIDATHRELLPRLHCRPVFEVDAPFVLHNTEIRKRVIEGNGSWEEYLPAGTIEVFTRISGDRRLRSCHHSE